MNAISPVELEHPTRRMRTTMYEGGWCPHHDHPTEPSAFGPSCRRCVAEFDSSLVVMLLPTQRRAS